jgi:uncharacterized phage protein gp47/JayE
MIIPTKTANTILNEMISQLRNTSDITNFSAGSMARTLLEVINTQLDTIYTSLNINLMQSFVSTASGTYLDYIGALIGCVRISGETDADYRYRITQQYLSFTRANETAVRLACLAVPGVKDVIMDEFHYGTGSFAIYIITDDLIPGQTTLTAAQSAVNENKSFGIYAKALAPNIADVNINYSFTFKKNSVNNIGSITSSLRENIQKYFDGLGMGGAVDISYLVRLPYTLFSNVLESRILKLEIDNQTVYSRESQKLSRVSRARVLNIKVNEL